MTELNVFLTVDVEMWPPHWGADHAEYKEAFQRYIHGVGNPRDYGLPFQLKVLAEHGLRAIFFVEPLFASVLGRNALSEVVGMILEAGQDVQLHLHPEWLGRGGMAELPGPYRLTMSELDMDGQAWLIGVGCQWLEEAGAPKIRAFRAGSFGANRGTIAALASCGLRLDFSQSRAAPRGPIDLAIPDDVTLIDHGVTEIPLTTYRDFLGRLRPLQVASSSFPEMMAAIRGCVAQQRRSAVILSHSAELLNTHRSRPDAIVRRRFLRLCRMLDVNRDTMITSDTDTAPKMARGQATGGTGLKVPALASLQRYAAQTIRVCGL